ncbi:hypothetical protein MMC25_005204 [Agyrium rufum]|nr:hypothetical protein [Agyrium rufum]
MSQEQGVQHHPEHPEGGRKYGAFQMELYRNGINNGIMPMVTTDPNKLQEQAKQHLSLTSYNYVAGGAGEKATMDANRLAFRQWKLIPRMLRPTTVRDLRTELFGHKLESPILVAPVGVQVIFHPDKESGVAEIAQQIGVPYILSTASSTSIEDVAKANGDGHRWYQLYWPQSEDVTASLLKRAKDNGYKVLVVTLDTWALGWRPADLDNAYVPFASGVGNECGFTDPVFCKKFEEKHKKNIREDIILASSEWEKDVFSGAAHTWEDIATLKKYWDGPILLKGIQHPEDAKLAVEAGVQGIIVSNHGGRQVDGAVGSLEMLPEIVAAVGDKLTVLFDSGVRTGADVIKALCLGAKGVLIGRPFVYGLGIGGKKGAKQALQGILADLDQTMGLAGIRTIADCNEGVLRKVQYGGDLKSSY